MGGLTAELHSPLPGVTQGPSSWDPGLLSTLPAQWSSQSQGSPTREELRGPSSYLEALPASPAQGREHRLILCKTNIFSGAAPASHTILFSSPTNPLIEDKAPVNPFDKGSHKISKNVPTAPTYQTNKRLGTAGRDVVSFQSRGQERCGRR